MKFIISIILIFLIYQPNHSVAGAWNYLFDREKYWVVKKHEYCAEAERLWKYHQNCERNRAINPVCEGWTCTDWEKVCNSYYKKYLNELAECNYAEDKARAQ